jgi:hypothetical protein
MPLVVTFNAGPKYRRNGKQKIVKGTIAFDASYPTGGEPLTASQMALQVVEHMTVHPGGGYVFEVIYSSATALLIKAYWQNEVAASVLVEVTNTTSLAALTAIRFTAYGR